MPKGLILLIAAQFVSGLADNALLIIAIAHLLETGAAPWWAPMLKFGFTLAYVLLAPFAGVLADAAPKQRVMAWTNLLKLGGCALMLVGADPVLAYSLVGLGAAIYSPAKYGLLTESVPPAGLVAANGWLEVSTVGAALLGTAVGALLVGPWFTSAGGSLAPALLVVIALYLLAALLNLPIPGSGARYPRASTSPRRLLREFGAAQRLLWRDRLGGLSLAVTTLCWGAGATLQFLVLRWGSEALGLSLDRAAWLQVVVALGIVAGAGTAGRRVALNAAPHLLPIGLVLGLLLPLLALVDSLAAAVPLLLLCGALAGFYVVPMNALLQHRGQRLLSAGRSIAVQNFNENLAVLAMLGSYAALLALELPLAAVLVLFGAFLVLITAALLWRERRRRRASWKPAPIHPPEEPSPCES